MMLHRAAAPEWDVKLMQNADLNDETRVRPYNEYCLSKRRGAGRLQLSQFVIAPCWFYSYFSMRNCVFYQPRQPQTKTEIDHP